MSEAMDILGGWQEDEVAAERDARRKDEAREAAAAAAAAEASGKREETLLVGKSGEECGKILSVIACVLVSAPADIAMEWKGLVLAVAGEAVWSGEECVRAAGQVGVGVWVWVWLWVWVWVWVCLGLFLSLFL